MPGETRYLKFEGMSQSVKLHDCDDLIPHLPLVFPGWKIDNLAVDDSEPVLTLSRVGRTYSLRGYWIDEPLVRNDDVEAVCALVAELMRAYVRQNDRLLCLHAAAAEFGGRLVVFPSHYHAGKSILSACLAAAGTRLFCDDILPLNLHDAEAIAPGLAPCLRKPLPANLKPESREFIESRTSLQGNNYSYLELGTKSMTARGEHLPIGAFVLLERRAGAAAEFETISEAEVLAQVVWQNFARETEAPTILAVLNRLVAGARRFRLNYDRAEDAVSLLQRKFDRWPDEYTRERNLRQECAKSTSDPGSLAPGYYRQAPGIGIVEADDQFFLADGQGAAIHHLNPTGSSIWGLLAEPMTRDEIVELLLSAFPGLDREQVTADVFNLLDELKGKNLLQLGS